MKKLMLETSYRNYLMLKNSLVLDADCDESLIGLSYSESVLYLNVLVMGLQYDTTIPVEKMELFLTMYDRHIAAGPRTPNSVLDFFFDTDKRQ